MIQVDQFKYYEITCHYVKLTYCLVTPNTNLNDICILKGVSVTYVQEQCTMNQHENITSFAFVAVKVSKYVKFSQI